MCGRYTSKKNPVEIAEEFDAVDQVGTERRPDYNVAPTKNEPVVRVQRPADGAAATADVRELVTMKWGLVPFWAKDPKTGGRMFNARVETVTSKPAFRAAARKRRCIVPADGYYEWQKLADGTKQPYYMTDPEGSSLAFAGLWETWGSGDDLLTTFTIITTPSRGRLADIHDRMPFLLPAGAWSDWLDPDRSDIDDLLGAPDLDRADGLELRPVGPEVGKVANNGPELIEELPPEAVLL